MAKPEPDNPVDLNAIAFYGKGCDTDHWNILGYVQVYKIPKMKSMNNEIVSWTMDIPQYKRTSNYSGYFSNVHVIKKNPWLPNDPTNSYNKSIH
jgi:hypothetical protein